MVALACGRGRVAADTNAKPPVDRLAEPVPVDRKADDVGRFLAGLTAKPGSELANLHESDAWVKHHRELDRAWDRLQAEVLPSMRTFQAESLGSVHSAVYYPFSGPDALMMTVFFPHSPLYVMVGLEPAGTLPAPKQLARKDMSQYLARIRLTVASVLGRSFFVTRQMDRQFRGQVTDGLLQPILELLVRTDHTILGFRYVRLDDEGRLLERASDYHAPGKIGNKGVEIDFRTEADGSVHKLLYLSVNLSDSSLRNNAPFQKFVSSLPQTATFLKATSYMLHKGEFSMVRDQILAKSGLVLQDDSGVPYHCFRAPDWRVQLYGDYVRPYGSFRYLAQPDLRIAYQTTGPKPLEFRIGYGYSRIPSNLLLAKRANQM